ncbi:hypothetical protein [Paraburkholderia sediminicola]
MHDVDELPAGHAQHTALQHRVICGERLPGSGMKNALLVVIFDD